LKNDITKINFCWLSEFQKGIFLQEFPECEIECKKHHISHAHSLYAFTKPRPNDLIVSFDGGGDDEDFFKLFHFENRQMRMMKEVKLNLGTPYRILGLISDEIKSAPVFEYDTNLHLPGKIMGLAPLGTVDENYIEPVENFYLGFRNGKASIYEKLKSLLDELKISYDNNLKVDKFVARNVLKTSQKVFEKLFFENANEIFDEKYDRILLVGGCSLNVKLNTEIYLKTQKNIFVPPISGDCGISLGAALSDMNLNEFTPYKNAFIGLECSDDITPYIEKYNPKHVSTNELADLLAKGKIVATIVGKIEAGARSLGNRSLLASPLCKGMKDKLNEIKEREFFRPIAPIVSKEKQSFYFEKSPISKYMTFTPKINPEFQDKLLEIVHYDSTCRIQTATREDGFIYDLLKDFGNLTGIEVLINTSFNVKGKPIINNLADAFELLETSGIDYLYINGLLFKHL
jgi:carbamoyltransferase